MQASVNSQQLPTNSPKSATPQYQAQTIGSVDWDITPAEESNEAFFVAPYDVITFTFAPTASSVWAAYDSDRICQYPSIPGSMHFHPKGAQVYCQWQNHHYGTWGVAPEFSQQITTEIGQGFNGIETLINMHDPVAQGLNTLVKQCWLHGELPTALATQSAVLMAYQSVHHHSSQKNTWQLERAKASRFSQVIEFIQAHLGEDLSLTELASVANMSLHHFSRTFKQAIGQTPHQYITEQRLQRAQQLIGNTRLPLAQIALDCGFASQSHLSQAFKRRFGVTPSGYRH